MIAKLGILVESQDLHHVLFADRAIGSPYLTLPDLSGFPSSLILHPQYDDVDFGTQSATLRVEQKLWSCKDVVRTNSIRETF